MAFFIFLYLKVYWTIVVQLSLIVLQKQVLCILFVAKSKVRNLLQATCS